MIKNFYVNRTNLNRLKKFKNKSGNDTLDRLIEYAERPNLSMSVEEEISVMLSRQQKDIEFPKLKDSASDEDVLEFYEILNNLIIS